MIKAYLWVIKLLAPLWKALGADTDQLILILKTKADIVLRSPVGFNQIKKKKDLKLPAWGNELLRMFLSAMFGFIYCAFLFIPNREIGLLYAVFLYLTTISMSMIMTFSTQLVNTTDNIVLLPRPIKDKTMVLYRLLFGIYQFLIASLPMALPLVVILMIQSNVLKGLYFGALLLPVLLLVFALLQMFIMLLLNIFSIRMFNKLVVWLQGILLISFFVCVQSSFWDKVSALDLNFTLKYTTLLSFMPPYWIVSIWLHTAPGWMYLALWAMPVVCLLFIITVLAPRYSSKLSKLGSGSDEATPKKKERIAAAASGFKKRKFFILKDSASQSAFVFMNQYMSRTKEFKMSALSSFYYVAITTFPVLLDVFKILQGQHIVIKDSKLLFPIYAFSFPLFMSIMTICASSYYNASFIFFAAPDNVRGRVKFGSGWAVFTRLFIPGFLIWSFIALFISKMAMWSNVILAFSNMLLLAMLYILFILKEVPLSLAAADQASKGLAKSTRIIVTTLLGVALGALHVVLLMKLYWWAHLLIASLDIIAAWLLADKISRNNK